MSRIDLIPSARAQGAPTVAVKQNNHQGWGRNLGRFARAKAKGCLCPRAGHGDVGARQLPRQHGQHATLIWPARTAPAASCLAAPGRDSKLHLRATRLHDEADGGLGRAHRCGGIQAPPGWGPARPVQSGMAHAPTRTCCVLAVSMASRCAPSPRLSCTLVCGRLRHCSPSAGL